MEERFDIIAMRLKARAETLYSDFRNFKARYESAYMKEHDGELRAIEHYFLSNTEQTLKMLQAPMEYLVEMLGGGNE